MSGFDVVYLKKRLKDEAEAQWNPHPANHIMGAALVRIEQLESERDKLRTLIETHNRICEQACKNTFCGAMPGTKCPDCPRDWRVEL